MFDNLRRAFKDAIQNFNRELARDQIPETVDALLKGMEREIVASKVGLESLKEQFAKARDAARAEGQEAETCRRREAMARKIGDEETAEIAARYAEKHGSRQHVLSEKARAIQAELRLRESEFQEMLKQVKEARANRDNLAAQAGRSQARDSIRETDDLFQDLDRMADKINSRDAHARDRDPLNAGPASAEAWDRSRREDEIDARLDELKRRMGRK